MHCWLQVEEKKVEKVAPAKVEAPAAVQQAVVPKVRSNLEMAASGLTAGSGMRCVLCGHVGVGSKLSAAA